MRYSGATAVALVFIGGITVFACGTSEESVFAPMVEVPDGGPLVEPPPAFLQEGGGGGCKPRTCAEADANCGPVGDGCGGTVDCGTCTLPEVCGGGGKPSTCGRSPCIPKTCVGQGISCGPAPDGCGGLIPSCGSCKAPEFCGGGGPSKCGDGSTTTAPDGGSCVPTTCAAVGADCGPAADGCGGLIPSCGSCTAPQTCGGGGTPSVCGGTAGCVPTTCALAGKDCGPIADGCGGLTPSCGSCTPPQICGGAGSPNNCGGSLLPPCVGLCLQQVMCPAMGDTTVSGTVLSPAENLPIFGALVYVPNDVVGPLPAGVTCDQCGAAALGKPLVSVKTGPDGKFVLKNMPVGVNIPLVVQLGKFRRQVVIPNVPACVNTALPTALTRLPKNKTEGDLPLIAISTGSVDGLECVLRKVGISDSEFTTSTCNGRVHLYQDNGAVAPTTGGCTRTSAAALYGNQAELDKHDMVIFGCVASRQNKAAADKQRVTNYANKGGRVYGTHYSYVWLYDMLPWSSTAKWVPDTAAYGSFVAEVDTSFPKGASFATWLGLPMVNALSTVTPPRITLNEARRDVDTPALVPAQTWLKGVSPATAIMHYTFNTEWGQPADKQCGRVLFSDFHVTTGSTTGVVFPGECSTTPLTAQEKVLAFMLFDLASCVQADVPPPPTCTPKTCAMLTPPAGCGLAGDGCGGVIDCGPCAPPETCGGGGVPFQCGAPSCVKKTCVGLGVNCGPVGDGCGGILDCGPCLIPGQICGGAGPSKCGGGACGPKTCVQQGLDCGAAGDTCGGLLDCGTCPPTFTCVGGKCQAPSCLPKTCAILGFNCGPAADGCGGLLNCGVCTAPGDTCGGGGFSNVCGGGLK